MFKSRRTLKPRLCSAVVFFIFAGFGLSFDALGDEKAAEFDLPLTSFESPQPFEANDTQSLIELLKAKMIKDYENPALQDHIRPELQNRYLRDAHPKAIGCVSAKLHIMALGDILAGGMPKANIDTDNSFIIPEKTYDAVIRFSNSSGVPKDDIAKDPRGMAVKIFGVPGKKLMPGQPESTEQDLILINAPVFVVRDVGGFLALATAGISGDKMELAKVILKPREFINFLRMQSQPASMLDERFFSITPYQLGPSASKFSLTPDQKTMATLPKEPTPHFLTEQLDNYLADRTASFTLSYQLQTKPKKMPVEDARIEWSEKKAPFYPVAKLVISRQSVDDPEKMKACDDLEMSPWKATEWHRPLGSINRARRTIYSELSKFRHEKNETSRTVDFSEFKKFEL